MRKILSGIVIAALGIFAIGAANVAATKPDPDHKVGICHRTASDTNPYVYIEVDVASELPGHLGNTDPGHKPTYWKSDGVWRGVAHSKNDPKDDYLANSKEDCQDTIPSSPPSGEPPSSSEPSEPVITPTPPVTPSDAPVPSEPDVMPPTVTPPPSDTASTADLATSDNVLTIVLLVAFVSLVLALATLPKNQIHR